MRRLITTLSIVALLSACSGLPKNVVRRTDTYIAETLSALQRQEAAAEALRTAAASARASGDSESCEDYLYPALVIETTAQPQAFRALFLAGLPYPSDQPTQPQADPGPPEIVNYSSAAEQFCSEEASHE